ncbi:MAG: twin transmembrane helix small protein [Betaproteobacteria bacterium]
MQFIIPLVFLGILISLGSALFFMMRDKGTSSNMVRSLFIRIGLSISLFIGIWVAHYFGLIQTTGIRVSN